MNAECAGKKVTYDVNTTAGGIQVDSIEQHHALFMKIKHIQFKSKDMSLSFRNYEKNVFCQFVFLVEKMLI